MVVGIFVRGQVARWVGSEVGRRVGVGFYLKKNRNS